tara:strand:- start:1117 stop:1368 length:252 start_codon:yes stop_codon:yes gene_type:complete
MQYEYINIYINILVIKFEVEVNICQYIYSQFWARVWHPLLDSEWHAHDDDPGHTSILLHKVKVEFDPIWPNGNESLNFYPRVF